MTQEDSIDGLRQLEAAAANVYFATFEKRVEVTFNRKDAARIPAHWERSAGGGVRSIRPALAMPVTWLGLP